MKRVSSMVVMLVLSAQMASAGTLYRVSNAELPRSAEVVNQNQYKHIPQYPESGTNSRWWLCGHAAFATAMNVLRSSNADDAKQLEYFHVKLLNYSRYADKVNNPHREAWGDDLERIVDARSDFSATKHTTTSRDTAKQKLKDAITSSTKQQIVVLTRQHGWGHFVVLHELYSDPGGSGGGYVKYADPLGGYASRQMGYTEFLNGMRDEGTSGRYSFWTISQ